MLLCTTKLCSLCNKLQAVHNLKFVASPPPGSSSPWRESSGSRPSRAGPSQTGLRHLSLSCRPSRAGPSQTGLRHLSLSCRRRRARAGRLFKTSECLCMLRSLRQLGIVGNPAPWDCIPVPVIPANSRDSESMNLIIIKTNEQTKKVGELTSFPNLNFFVRLKTYINYLNKQPSVHSVECLVQLLSDKSHGQSRK